MFNNAEGLVNLIREIVRDETQKLDKTVPCLVDSVLDDGNVNVLILPDLDTVISNVSNPNGVKCKKGDMVLLYKIRNQINNSFILMNYNNKNN